MSQPKQIMVNEGETIKLPCVVDNLGSDLEIFWKKGDTMLAVGDNILEQDSR